MRLMILQRRFMIQKNIKSSESEIFTFFYYLCALI